MSKRQNNIVVFLLAILVSLTACGKKAPPFITEKNFPFQVNELNVQWPNETVKLQGKIAAHPDEMENFSRISGCRVFYAYYFLDDPPCEGCPIKFKLLKEIAGKVGTEGQFFCDVYKQKENGIHFFKVRLMGQKKQMGPNSDYVRIVIQP